MLSQGFYGGGGRGGSAGEKLGNKTQISTTDLGQLDLLATKLQGLA